MMESLKIQEQIDAQSEELVTQIPVLSARIVDSLQFIKKQQEACSSSMMKEKLEQNFQLGGLLLMNYSTMINQLPEYIRLTDEARRIRKDSLMNWGDSIKDAVDGGAQDELTAKLGKQQIECFSAMVKSYENSITAEMVAELVILTLIYSSISTTDLILSGGKNSENEHKKRSLLEFGQVILGFAPVIGDILGVKDFFLSLKAIEDAFCSGNALHPDLQTADEQLAQMELQCTKLQENLVVQKKIIACLDDSLKRKTFCAPQ
jgi:hypothetical protein